MVGLIPVSSAIFFWNSTVKELSPTPPPRRLCFHFVCLRVCLQYYTRNTPSIFTEFSRRMARGPWKNQRFWCYSRSRYIRVTVWVSIGFLGVTVEIPRQDCVAVN